MGRVVNTARRTLNVAGVETFPGGATDRPLSPEFAEFGDSL